MLSTQTLNASINTAESLVNQGIVLSATPDTPLANLVSSSALPFELSSEEIDADALVTTISRTTEGTLEDPSQHNSAMDRLVETLSVGVRAHVNYAKNTVKPRVMEFAKTLEEFRAANGTVDAASKFNIRELSVPAPLLTNALQGSVERYAGQTVITPDIFLDLEKKTTDELVELMTTGAESVDREIVAWLSSREDLLQNVFTSFFTRADSDTLVKLSTLDQVTNFERLDYSLIMFLVSRKLFEDVDGSSNMSLAVYREACVQMRDYSGALLFSNLKNIAQSTKIKQLVVRSSAATKTIDVNSVVYREWLVGGGSPDVILGLLVSGDTAGTVASIDANNEKWTNAWSSFLTFSNVNENNRFFDVFKDFIRSEFSKQLGDLDESERGYAEAHPKYYENVNKLFEDILSVVTTKELEDCNTLALRLVAETRYYYTSSYKILCSINEAYEANPDVDVREAALLAVICYITDYLSDQLSVVK